MLSLVPGEPQKVNIIAVNSTAIRVEWKPPLEKEQYGIIGGYQIHVQELDQKVRVTCMSYLAGWLTNNNFFGAGCICRTATPLQCWSLGGVHHRQPATRLFLFGSDIGADAQRRRYTFTTQESDDPWRCPQSADY